MIGNRGRTPRGGSFTHYVALLNSLRHGAEAVVFNFGSLSLSLSLSLSRTRIFSSTRHHPRPPATTAASARRLSQRDGTRCASSINSTDKRKKRATTCYVILTGCTARRAKCDVVVRPLRVPRSDKLRYLHARHLLSSSLGYFSLAPNNTSLHAFISIPPLPVELIIANSHRSVVAKSNEKPRETT